MKKSIKLLSVTSVIMVFMFSSVFAADWEMSWETTDLANPESVVYDETRDILFVSNQNYAKSAVGGTIAKISTSGAVIDKEWVKGLKEPKGLHIQGSKLYVADVTKLLEIDIESGKILKEYLGKEAKFLNDVTSDNKGRVYVSDMFTSSIYRLNKKGEFTKWISSLELENPNGLLCDNGYMYIAAWGRFTNGKPLEAPKGNFIKIKISNKKISKISTKALGNLDGLQKVSSGEFLLSDWVAGGVYSFSKKSGVNKIISTPKSSGDILHLKEKGMIIIPMAVQGKLLSYVKSDIKREVGVRRDNSYYTRVEWSNATLNTPLYWVSNINDDDTSRNGGSWGAPTMGPAEVVLSFFGEQKSIRRMKLFHNVGATISPLDELAKKINVFVSNDSGIQRIGDEKAELDNFKWKKVLTKKLKQKVGWNEFVLPKSVKAKYIRLQLVENFGTPKDRAYTETNEVKFYAK